MKKTKFEKYCLLFTIFIFGSFIGFILENLYTIVIKGNYALRQGLIYEPLIPIYGLGALTMYFLLKDKQKTDKFLILKIFIIGFLAGSLIEYICSYMQQNIFGTISWDYSKKMFNINGRINLFHSILWGLLGILFYYLILPMIEQIKIRDRKVKVLLAIISCIFVIDCTISALACYRQKERRENLVPSNKIEILLDKHYPDEYLDKIYNNAKVVKIKWKNSDKYLLENLKW